MKGGEHMGENPKFVSINRVAMMLDISDHTITRWYKWWESPEFEKPEGLYLPPYQYVDRRKTKYFLESDIQHLEKFKTVIMTTNRGAMAEFNAAYQWGKRGEEVLKNRGKTVKDVQKKMR